MHRISAKEVGGWMAWYAGTRNKEILALPGDVTGVANFDLLRSMYISPELAYGTFEDFAPSYLTSTTAYPGYSVDQITTGTLVMADEVGGILQLTPAATTGRGIQMQSDGEMFKCAATKDIWFEASIRGNDVTNVNWAVGLASTDTNVFSTQPTDLIIFATDSGDANLDFQVRSGGTGAASDTGTDLSNSTFIRVGFFVNGVTSVTPYINGTAQTAVTSNIPTANMSVTFAVTTGENAANLLEIDWYKIVQLR